MKRAQEFPDTDTQLLVAKYREEIAHHYDPVVTRIAVTTVRWLIRTCFVSETVCDGISNIRTIPSGTPIILSSIHKSHLDYLILGLALFRGLSGSVTATIAGKNLFHGLFSIFLPRFKAVCLDRERANMKNLHSRENLLYLSTFYDYLVEEVLNRGDGITIYPEGGRSYSGTIMPLSMGIFGIAKRALQSGHKCVAIVPIGMSYDRVTEDERFTGLTRCKEHSAKAYRAYDKRGFIRHALFQPRSTAYIDIGEPMYIDDLRHMETLALELRTRMSRLVRVTPVSLVCRALAGFDSRPLDDALNCMREDLLYVCDQGLCVGHSVKGCAPEFVFEAARKHLCNRIRMRDIIRMETVEGTQHVLVRRRDVVTYYVNTVAHLFQQ